MHADFDLSPDGDLVERVVRKPFTPPPQNKGGRPHGYSPKKAAEVKARMEAGELDDVDPASEDGQMATSVKHAIAKARKETALADLNELEFKIKSGQYLPRSAYREATATLLATLSQGMRSLTDTLESKFGLAPEVLEQIDAQVNESLNNIAETLAMFAGEEDEV